MPNELIVKRRILIKMKNILDNPEHPLHNSDSTSVSSVRGFFRSAATQTATGDPSYPQLITLRGDLDNKLLQPMCPFEDK